MTLRQIGPDHMNCKDPECYNAEFWITRDGRIICSDDECFAEYGRLADPVAVTSGPGIATGREYGPDPAGHEDCSVNPCAYCTTE